MRKKNRRKERGEEEKGEEKKKSKALKTSLLPAQSPQRQDLDMLVCSLGTKEEEESWEEGGGVGWGVGGGGHDSTRRDGGSEPARGRADVSALFPCDCVRLKVKGAFPCAHTSMRLFGLLNYGRKKDKKNIRVIKPKSVQFSPVD